MMTWRAYSAGEISLFMFLLFSSGVLLWSILGNLLYTFPIILANGVTLASSIFAMKIKGLRAHRLRVLAAGQRGL